MADAIFYDGERALRRVVALRISTSAVDIDENGVRLASWPTGSIRRTDTTDGGLRLTLDGGPDLARLQVSDPADQAAVLLHCARLEAGAPKERTGRIVLWSLLAVASITLTILLLLPIVAEHLTPLVPTALEKRLGRAVDNQIKLFVGSKTCAEPAGAAALRRLTAQLQEGAQVGGDAEVIVLDSRIPNAIALPGGRIYLFDGLLNRANSVDEIAGVLVHELGHVHGRDGLRKLIQAGGSSYLLGLMFGDVAGGGALVLVTRMVIEGAYSRDAERAADAFASRTMLALGRRLGDMALLLKRVDKGDSRLPPLLSTHPLTDERLETLGRLVPERPGKPLLSEEEWRALKEICMTS